MKLVVSDGVGDGLLRGCLRELSLELGEDLFDNEGRSASSLSMG